MKGLWIEEKTHFKKEEVSIRLIGLLRVNYMPRF